VADLFLTWSNSLREFAVRRPPQQT
jgi:hypothetical protein